MSEIATQGTQSTATAPSRERRDELIENHVGLVRHIVRRIARRVPPSVDIDDLIAAGLEGLLHAAQRFDPERGVAFSTFAGCTIRGSVLDALRGMDPLARPTRGRVQQLERAESALAGKYAGPIPPDVLAREAGLTPNQVRDAQQVNRAASVVSLDTSTTDGSLAQIIEDPRAADVAGRILLREAHDVVREELEGLCESDRNVIVMYYADGLLLREIAEVLGVTEGRISQIHKRAIECLRRAVRRRGLID